MEKNTEHEMETGGIWGIMPRVADFSLRHGVEGAFLH